MFILRPCVRSDPRTVSSCDAFRDLDDVERFVEERFAARASRPVGHCLPGHRRPHRVAPLNRPVHQTDELWARRIRWRLAGGKRLRPRVADHHRRADRHPPEAPTVALAERLRLLEELLCSLLIDLRYGRWRESHEQAQGSRGMKRSCPHRAPCRRALRLQRRLRSVPTGQAPSNDAGRAVGFDRHQPAQWRS